MNGMVKTAPGRRLNETAMANLRVNRWSARFEGPLLGVGQHASGLMCVVEPLEGRVRVRVGRRVVEAKVGRAIRVPAGVVHEVEAPQGRVDAAVGLRPVWLYALAWGWLRATTPPAKRPPWTPSNRCVTSSRR